MKYLVERSLFYYFLMEEIKDAGTKYWRTIADLFGVNLELITTYGHVIREPMLDELLTTDDIDMYRNYLNGFLHDEVCFGKAKIENDVIEAKALALQKAQQLFGNTQIKVNRLHSLSHIYEKDHIASVLYALQLLCTNAEKSVQKYAGEILQRELYEGQNSDAGFVLLKLKSDEAAETADRLINLPDILICPDMLKYLTAQYGKNETLVFKTKRNIGF